MLKDDIIIHVSLKFMNFNSFQLIAWLAYIVCYLQKFIFTIAMLILTVLFLFIFIHYQVSLLHDVIEPISSKSGRIIFFLKFFKNWIYHAQVVGYFYHPRLIIIS